MEYGNNQNTQASREISSEKQNNKSAANSTNQLWFSENQGKHFLIDANGKKVNCNNGGQLFPKYNPQLTGYASFNKRSEVLAQLQKEYGDKPLNPSEAVILANKSLRFLHEPPKSTYLPSLNKFEGYVQFRCPVIKNQSKLEQAVNIKEQANNMPNEVSKSKRQNLKNQRQSQIFQTLPTIVDNPSLEILNEQQQQENKSQMPLIINSDSASQSPRFNPKQRILNKQNVSALYKSYKSSSKPTDYFQQSRVYKIQQESANKILDQYSSYLSKSQYNYGKRRNSQSSGRNAMFSENRTSVENMKETAINIFNDKSIGNINHAKIAELSLKIISHKESQENLRSPPIEHKIQKNNGTKNRQATLLQSQDQKQSMMTKDNSLSRIYKSPDSIMHASSSIQNFATMFPSQKMFGTLNSQPSQDLTVMSSIQNNNEYIDQNSMDNNRRYASIRYKSYTDLKTQQVMAQTINEYQQLKTKDQGKISGFMQSSPRQEYERQMQQESQNIFLQDDQEIIQGSFSGLKNNRYSVSPRVKSVLDFNTPFLLTNFPDPKEKELLKLKELNSMKRSTVGLFKESIDALQDPGDHWRKDRKQILNANPHATMLLKKQDDFENRKAIKKKHMKRLQAIALEQDIKIQERKVYKKFIKY